MGSGPGKVKGSGKGADGRTGGLPRKGRLRPGVFRLRPAAFGVLFSILALAATPTACAGQSEDPAGLPSTSSGSETAAGPGQDAGSGQDGRIAGSRGSLRLARVARFDRPVEIKSAPGFPRLLFVVEQEGRVRVLRRGHKLARPFLDIRGRVESGGERGLLSIAFPGDYRKTKRFYVYYTDSTGDIRVDEFRRRTAVRARRNSGRRVITIRHRENANHNGGQMHFLGKNLYFGTGDGGGGGDVDGNAQNLDSLLGKMIRIDPRRKAGRPYTIPGSNPFVGRPGRDEIFAYGLRNPFRWSFDLTTGKKPRMVIADVGQEKFEEVNDVALKRAKGANFGWNVFEGFSTYEGPAKSGTVKPVLVLPHPPSCSVIGGLVVEDRKVPALRGRYIFSDFCDNRIRSFRPATGRIGAARATGLSGPQISSFGTNARGTVYMTSLEGPVYRLAQ